MVFTKPEGYSKKKVDWAGGILIDGSSSKEDRNEAIAILVNWRAIHRYPMHIFKKRLKNVSEKMFFIIFLLISEIKDCFIT